MDNIKDVFILIYIIILIIFYIIIGILGIYGVRLSNTEKNRSIIIRAISLYHSDCIRKNKQQDVCYEDMESYNNTNKRIKDWGYYNILPPDKFEKIKPFLKEAEKMYENSNKRRKNYLKQ